MDGSIRVGILYESGEWSDFKLRDEVQRFLKEQAPSGAQDASPGEAVLIDMEEPRCIEEALQCTLLVSRVFASARFRGHSASHRAMERLIPAAENAGIPLLNPGIAHGYEVDKRAATEALGRAGMAVPAIYACGLSQSIDAASLPYPCIIKPNCGGRTTATALAADSAEAERFLAGAPAIEFIAQQYIEPIMGFITRAEVVDGAVPLIVKRSVAEGGLSAYHLGSRYSIYRPHPQAIEAAVLKAAETLGFAFGSFDIIETPRGAFFIDANSVSNVSEDCTELFGYDLMAAYGKALARRARAAAAEGDPRPQA